MKRLFVAIFVAASVLIPARGILAQSDGTQVTPDRKAVQQSHRAELVKKIEQLKYERMTSALALDAESAPKFFDLYKPAEKDIQGLVRQRNEELRKLGLLINGAKSDADVDPEMAKIRESNQQIESREQTLDNDLKGILSPRQRAKLLVFEHEFNQRLRQEVAQHRLAKNGDAHALRQLLRQERVRNRLLRKLGQSKSSENK
jgi:Spy/CpxP family protein refolding chaperone